MTMLDKAFFQYTASKLKDAAPNEVVEYYVRNLICANEGYLDYLIAEYHLPSKDFLKLHERITQLAETK